MPGKPTPFFDDFYKQVASKSIKLETKIYNQFYLMVILFLCELVSLTFFILNQFGFGILLLITFFLSICLWWINKNLEMLFQEIIYDVFYRAGGLYYKIKQKQQRGLRC